MKDEIRRSLAEATPGPWEYAESDNGHEIRMGTAIESTGRKEGIIAYPTGVEHSGVQEIGFDPCDCLIARKALGKDD